MQIEIDTPTIAATIAATSVFLSIWANQRWFAAMESRFNSIDGRFSSVESRFNSIDSRLTNLDNRTAETNQRITALESRIAHTVATKDDLRELREELLKAGVLKEIP